jgi:NAD(P)-dependent dehydrogenase (short-subunit alcohol dehydrogenase family)
MTGKVALATGGACGIGGAIAKRFVEAGAAVSIFDLDGGAGCHHADRLRPMGRVTAIQRDVTKSYKTFLSLPRSAFGCR